MRDWRSGWYCRNSVGKKRSFQFFSKFFLITSLVHLPRGGCAKLNLALPGGFWSDSTDKVDDCDDMIEFETVFSKIYFYSAFYKIWLFHALFVTRTSVSFLIHWSIWKLVDSCFGTPKFIFPTCQFVPPWTFSLIPEK